MPTVLLGTSVVTPGDTSETTAFNLDLAQLVEEAYERCGGEMRTGYDLRTARRSLNLLFADWANRGLNMWTFEEGSIPLVAGTATYELPIDTVDLMEVYTRTGMGINQKDVQLTRVSLSNYSAIVNKNMVGEPSQVLINRVGTPSITVWPVPKTGVSALIVYWRLRRIQDAGDGHNIQDVPFRFLPAMVAGLAYYLALKVNGALERISVLKQQYDEAWLLAAEEDREKASIRLVPRVR